MDARAAWDIATILGGSAASGLTVWIVTAFRVGRRVGIAEVTLDTIHRERVEEKRLLAKERAMQSRQNMRIFAAIEQLRRLHKTGNGGIVWEKLDSGGE